jgi:hypothetical protein
MIKSAHNVKQKFTTSEEIYVHSGKSWFRESYRSEKFLLRKGIIWTLEKLKTVGLCLNGMQFHETREYIDWYTNSVKFEKMKWSKRAIHVSAT